jgi:hypothetical protein
LLFEGVPIVPVDKLNSFIIDLDNHVEGNSFCDYGECLPLPDDIPILSGEFFGTVE